MYVLLFKISIFNFLNRIVSFQVLNGDDDKNNSNTKIKHHYW